MGAEETTRDKPRTTSFSYTDRKLEERRSAMVGIMATTMRRLRTVPNLASLQDVTMRPCDKTTAAPARIHHCRGSTISSAALDKNAIEATSHPIPSGRPI